MKFRSVFHKKEKEEDPLALLPLPQKAAEYDAMDEDCENVKCMARNETVWSMPPYTPRKRATTRAPTKPNTTSDVKPIIPEVSPESMFIEFCKERDRQFDQMRATDPKITAMRTNLRTASTHNKQNPVNHGSLVTNLTTPRTISHDSGFYGSPHITQSPTSTTNHSPLTISQTTNSVQSPVSLYQDSCLYEDNFGLLGEDSRDRGVASTSQPITPTILRAATRSRLTAPSAGINYLKTRRDKDLNDQIDQVRDRLLKLGNAEVESSQSVAEEKNESPQSVCEEYHDYLRDSVKNSTVAEPHHLSSELSLDELNARLIEIEEEIARRSQQPWIDADQDEEQEQDKHSEEDEVDDLAEFDLERANSILDFYYGSSLNEQVNAGYKEGLRRRSPAAMSMISEHDTESELDFPPVCDQPYHQNPDNCGFRGHPGAVFDDEPTIPHDLDLLHAPAATLPEQETTGSGVPSSGSDKALPALPEEAPAAPDSRPPSQASTSAREEGSEDYSDEEMSDKEEKSLWALLDLHADPSDDGPDAGPPLV